MTPIELAMMQYTAQSRDGVPIGKITITMGISLHDASSAYRNLKKEGLIDAPSGTIQLTAKGREWIHNNQDQFIFSKKKIWRKVPDHYKADSLKPFEPYAPRISQLNKFFFKLGK